MADPTAYHMPAEWEPHEATWIAWPHETSDWPGKFHPIPWVYGEIVRKLSQVEVVRILIAPKHLPQARRVLQKSGANMSQVEFVECFTTRSWTRDYCPIFVRNQAGEVAVTNWKFNAWAKYPNFEEDDSVAGFLAERFGMQEFTPKHNGSRIVLEGGAIDVNGKGSLLTTEECLLSTVQQRNPGMNREQIEEAFAKYLGVRKVLWLDRGIAGDDTHGHVDDLARFVNPHTVVLALEQDPSEVNFEPLQANLRRLEQMTDQDGRKLDIVPLPMPRPLYFDGQRLPASYANFYIANGLVLVPTFNDPADREALTILARLFPDREVCGIHSVDLVLGLGTLHCLTQQQPAALPGQQTP